jgi:nucleoside-diphosphate-sugar epimerase
VLRRMQEGKPVPVSGDGTSLWAMTDSRDFARAFVGLMGKHEAIGQAYHITTDEVLPWNSIYASIAKAVGGTFVPCYVPATLLALCKGHEFTGSLIGDKSNCVVFDNSKVKKAVPGWSAQIRYEDGIRNTVDFILSHPECQVPDPEFDLFCDRVAEVMSVASRSLAAI